MQERLTAFGLSGAPDWVTASLAASIFGVNGRLQFQAISTISSQNIKTCEGGKSFIFYYFFLLLYLTNTL